LIYFCFNPCFGGFCSKTYDKNLIIGGLAKVSILVLVDFALKHKSGNKIATESSEFQSLFWWILL